jgi:hypothetical protein
MAANLLARGKVKFALQVFNNGGQDLTGTFAVGSAKFDAFNRPIRL